MDRIYLDHSATTPIREEVFAAMAPFLTGPPGNATSAHGFGRDAREAVEQAREQVANLLHAKPRDIFFTSGGTESNNAAVYGLWEAGNASGRKHIVVAAIEHHAVLHAAEWLATHRGAAVTAVPADADGRVHADAVRDAITDETALVCLMHGNNETGVLQPVDEVAAACMERGVPLHCDAVQSAGKVPVDVSNLPVAMLALSAHKVYGPQGVGACFIRQGRPFEPVAVGGAQERGRRAGTENVAGIVGLGAACALAAQELAAVPGKIADMRDEFEAAVLAAIPGTRINGGAAPRLPHIANLSFPGIDGETLLQALDIEGIAVSTGSACTSGSAEASHVLLAMGQPEAEARTALRFSLGRGTTRAELERVAECLGGIVTRMRNAHPLTPRS